MTDESSAVVLVPAVAAGAGASRRVMRAYGEEVQVHLGGAETGGRLTMFTNVTPVGGGPPPHRHEREDEWFFVLEGQVSFLAAAGRWTEPLGPGTSAFVPRGAVHAFKNVGQVPLKQLITTSPAGFEIFFARSETEFQRPGGPRMEMLMEIAEEFGIAFEPG
jgi:mannose-6-phosphate isomerase-like protein (cupin superfamily)